MSATEVDVAATTANFPPVADANEPDKQGAESAPAVSNTDEDTSRVIEPVQKRIDELTRRRYDAERERDYWREHAQRVQAQKPESPPPAEEPETAGKTLADFGYDEAKYQAHLFKLAEERAVKAAEGVLTQKQQQEARTQTVVAHRARETAFAKNAPDYFEVAHHAPITNAMAELVMESENSAALAYHLGKNPEIALKISQLPERQQARELGRIEAKLSDVPKPPAVSAAPPPAPKLGGASDAGAGAKPDSPDSDKLSDAEWARRRNQQVAKRRGT